MNISKGGFSFAASAQVPRLMTQFEHDVLQRNTPCNFKDRAEVIRTLAETHVELVLIHPFREGNGRLARILSILMALQARLPLLDFSLIAGGKGNVFCCDTRGDGQELPADGEVVCRNYREERCVVLSGAGFLVSSNMRAIESTEAPVSMAVELATLVISALRSFSGSRR